MKDKKDISYLNKLKYAMPPKWEQIQSLVDEFGISYRQFEKFYGLTENLLTQIKSGAKRLPPHKWHLIYERVKPAYGVGFIEDYSPIKQKHKPTKRIYKPIPQLQESHDRLVSVK